MVVVFVMLVVLCVVVLSGCRHLPYVDKYHVNTRCTWAGGTCANYPFFFENCQFHVNYRVTLVYVLNFVEFLIHDSRGFII